ncbi:MAG: hypothetical protein LBT05_08895 [Planctomycetaceae bacterium]|nr:hypothetical protein [Planctomycetaceae bacterium]
MRKILLIVLLTTIVGCSPNNKPSDLPPLYPCTIAIKQDDLPLTEAAVELLPIPPTVAKYRAASITGTDGKASMTTYGFSGVPAGKYKVVISKNIQDDLVYGDNPSTGQKEIVSFQKYATVESKYSSTETTPYEIEITGKKKKAEHIFDVGKSVKIKIRIS